MNLTTHTAPKPWLTGGVRIQNRHTGQIARVLPGKSKRGNWRLSYKRGDWVGWSEREVLKHWEPASDDQIPSVP